MARGIAAVQLESEPLKSVSNGEKYPCYIGQAPIWQVDTEKWQDLAGSTLILSSVKDMRNKLGYFRPESGSWGKEFSLCMAADYHFRIKMMGPIIVIVNKAAITVKEKEEHEILFVDGVAEIKDPYVVLNTVSIIDKEKGIDYQAEYDENGRTVKILALTEIMTAKISYQTVDPELLNFETETLEELDFLEQTVKTVADVVSAPLWENAVAKGETVGKLLIDRIQEPLNSHWYVQTCIQLSGDTAAEARESKKNYKDHKAKTCWPCAEKDGCIYPLSVVFIAAKQRVDSDNEGIPYVSASNEIIDIDGLCTESGGKIRIKEKDATELNNIGIATANFSMMQWVTWGVCMSNYEETAKENIPPDKLNDVAVQMKDYVSNVFQERYARQIDKPMGIRQTRDIVNDFQMYLDSLSRSGALISGTISFDASENSTASLADGEFVFTITEANTPPGKAITGKISYSPEALEGYFDNMEGEE